MLTKTLKPPAPARHPSALHPLPLGLKARLRLGAAHDDAEKQADRVADRIVANPSQRGLAVLPPSAGGQANPVRNALATVTPRRAPSQASTSLTGDVESMLPERLEPRLLALLQGGQTLPDAARQDMQPHFGIDLAAVRIHTDAEAARLNDAVGAHAFALGEHIAFAPGKFAPDHPSGRHLLAHELAHVAQFHNQVPAVEPTPVRRAVAEDPSHLPNGNLAGPGEYGQPGIDDANRQKLRSINRVVTARHGQPSRADDIAPD
jgi:hypothetical protein